MTNIKYNISLMLGKRKSIRCLLCKAKTLQAQGQTELVALVASSAGYLAQVGCGELALPVGWLFQVVAHSSVNGLWTSMGSWANTVKWAHPSALVGQSHRPCQAIPLPIPLGSKGSSPKIPLGK